MLSLANKYLYFILLSQKFQGCSVFLTIFLIKKYMVYLVFLIFVYKIIDKYINYYIYNYYIILILYHLKFSININNNSIYYLYYKNYTLSFQIIYGNGVVGFYRF